MEIPHPNHEALQQYVALFSAGCFACLMAHSPPSKPASQIPNARSQELYLCKNYISDINDICYLSGLQDLRVLWLVDNPCADHPMYRQIVARTLPSVQELDNQEITPQVRV